MGLMFSEAAKRLRLGAGLYGQTTDSLALNLVDAAAAGRLFLDLYVSNSTFVATESDLAKITSVANLQAVTGLAEHQGAGYASKSINTATPTVDSSTDKVVWAPDPTDFTWSALAAATAGYSLQALLVRYDNGAGTDLPVYWHNGNGVTAVPMVGGDVNVSLPFIDAVFSIGT